MPPRGGRCDDVTIEVRQMLIRSRVGGPAQDEPTPEATARAHERLLEALRIELKAWLDERLREREER